MGAEKPELTPGEAFGQRVKAVQAIEDLINEVDGTSGRKNSKRRKSLDKTVRTYQARHYRLKPTPPTK